MSASSAHNHNKALARLRNQKPLCALLAVRVQIRALQHHTQILAQVALYLRQYQIYA